MSEKLFTILFVVFLGGFFLLHVFGEDQAFSEQENRFLAQKPRLTWAAFKSGDYTADVETYLADQFPYKDTLVGFKGKIEQALGKQENNGVLFGADGYLLERFELDNNRLKRNVQRLNGFAALEQVGHVYALLPPTAIAVYPEKVPRYVTTVSQTETLSEVASRFTDAITLIDVHAALLKHKDEALYFKTDHHWTMRGAYVAYVAAAEQMGFTPLPIAAFTVEVASESFHGTLYSKATAYDHAPDDLELFIPPAALTVEVTYEDGAVADALFAREFLATKDKYATFLGGNHSLVTVKTNAGTGRKLAILKDSFAHAFIPFLAPHFDELHVLDLRYNKTAVSDYLADYGIAEVLFLYNLPNFTADTSLGLLR